MNPDWLFCMNILRIYLKNVLHFFYFISLIISNDIVCNLPLLAYFWDFYRRKLLHPVIVLLFFSDSVLLCSCMYYRDYNSITEFCVFFIFLCNKVSASRGFVFFWFPWVQSTHICIIVLEALTNIYVFSYISTFQSLLKLKRKIEVYMKKCLSVYIIFFIHISY